MKIRYVNASKKPGGKFGNIKMEDGTTYFVNSGLLNQYQPGMDITPAFDVQKWGDSQVNVIFPHWSPTMNGGAQAPSAQAPQWGVAGGDANAAAARATPQTNNPPSISTEGQIFITGVTGRAMGSGKFEATDIKMIALAALEAWRELQAKL